LSKKTEVYRVKGKQLFKSDT